MAERPSRRTDSSDPSLNRNLPGMNGTASFSERGEEQHPSYFPEEIFGTHTMAYPTTARTTRNDSEDTALATEPVSIEKYTICLPVVPPVMAKDTGKTRVLMKTYDVIKKARGMWISKASLFASRFNMSIVGVLAEEALSGFKSPSHQAWTYSNESIISDAGRTVVWNAVPTQAQRRAAHFLSFNFHIQPMLIDARLTMVHPFELHAAVRLPRQAPAIGAQQQCDLPNVTALNGRLLMNHINTTTGAFPTLLSLGSVNAGYLSVDETHVNNQLDERYQECLFEILMMELQANYGGT